VKEQIITNHRTKEIIENKKNLGTKINEANLKSKWNKTRMDFVHTPMDVGIICTVDIFYWDSSPCGGLFSLVFHRLY
jgi:Ser-tRNA(Ala) deacylase AlaX